MTLLVTGGAGFIGSNFVLDWFATSNEPVVNLDALTYAGAAGDKKGHFKVHSNASSRKPLPIDQATAAEPALPGRQRCPLEGSAAGAAGVGQDLP